MQPKKFFHNTLAQAIRLKRRGQTMVLYALLIPLLILFVGVGMDLGWYYLNVSRLQNAADAAALAGAMKLMEQTALEDYHSPVLVEKPKDLFSKEYYTVYTRTEDEYGNVSYTLDNSLKNSGDKNTARFYANKNLIDVEKAASDAVLAARTKVLNEWNVSQNEQKKKDYKNLNVKFEAGLYATALDYESEQTSKKSANGIKYYVVTLTEEIGHMFFQGKMFGPMQAKVFAYAELRPNDLDLVTSVERLKKDKTIVNWEYQNKFHNYTQRWNHYRYSVGGNKRVSYTTGDDFRTETVNVQKTGGSGIPTSANGNKYYDEYSVDTINIDFNQDFGLSAAISVDWDIRMDDPTGAKIKYINNDGWDANHGYDLRIQGLINFNDAWRNRNLLDSDTTNNKEPDIMWTRIESDPMWSKGVPWGNQLSLDSVHQMIININFDNTEVVDYDDKGNKITDAEGNPYYVYKYRPFFIFYDGPESNEPNSHVRDSQPVILNLNTDFNGILYAPNSPVIINGNGNKLTGFVVAKEYLFLKTDDDYPESKYAHVTDGYGHTIFVDDERLLEESQVQNTGFSKKNSAGDIYFYENKDFKGKILAEYRKVTTANGETKYIKEETTTEYNDRVAEGKDAPYYMKVTKSGANNTTTKPTTLNPPIIVDNKGDLQTKPLTPSDVFSAKTKAQNDALESKVNRIFGLASEATLRSYYKTYTRATNSDEQPGDPGNEGLDEDGKYRRTSVGHQETDYKIPALERVYLNTAFNLLEDSRYSYFQIPELQRVNYTYMNTDELNHLVRKLESSRWEPSEKWDVEDMFFTTTRGSWID